MLIIENKALDRLLKFIFHIYPNIKFHLVKRQIRRTPVQLQKTHNVHSTLRKCGNVTF